MSIFVGVLNLIFLVAVGGIVRFILVPFMSVHNPIIVNVSMFSTFMLGIYLLRETAKIIASTTSILKDRTDIASGLLQSIGTAFPDMVIGVIAAIMSLKWSHVDPVRSINLAIIAASTTFGSNIYNVFYAVWCIYRQNIANRKGRIISMIPLTGIAGLVRPIKLHKVKPKIEEFDTAIQIMGALSFLTALVAIVMVLFGKVLVVPLGISGDLYRLTRPLGFVVLAVCIWIMFKYRKNKAEEENYDIGNVYVTLPTARIVIDLVASGIIILLAAEAIIKSISLFADITKLPYVLVGVLTALIGCLGEIMVIHSFTVNPNGRVADAIIGVAMDNVVTTMGAAFVAILGGIFLGSEALIVIFVLILLANTLLVQQISNLKNYYLRD